MTVRHACAMVACDYPNRSVAMDALTYSANACGTLGFTALKLFLSPNYKGDLDASTGQYINQTWDGAHTTLTSLAGDSHFHTVFNDSRFTRFFIDTWSFGLSIYDLWRQDITTAQLAAEYTEWYNLAVFLLSTYSGKEFVLQSGAEADWALIGSFNPASPVPPYRAQRYAAYLNVHQRAVEAARRATPSTSTVIHAVEVNRTLDDYSERVHRTVLPLVHCDAVSYTAYEAINFFGSTQAEAIANLRTYLTKALRRIKAAVPGTRVYIGEYAWAQDEAAFTSLGLNTGALIDEVISICNDEGISDLVYWQIFDNEEQSAGVPRGFNLYNRNGNATTPGALNVAGLKYQSIL